MTILIKGGRVIDPATETDAIADVLIENGCIVKIEKDMKAKADRLIQAKGCYVMPGFVDLHVHLRDPGYERKENIETGAKAAARGGFTTILAMPNTKPVVDNPDVISYVHHKAKAVAPVNVLQIGAVTKGQKGEELSDIGGMVKAGCPAISEDGRTVKNTTLYRQAMLTAAKLGIPVFAHCEDENLLNHGVVNAGETARRLNLPGITNSTEDVIIARDMVLAKETGAKLHLCHCSTKMGAEMVKMGKQSGLKVSAEVCPHHFTLTDAEIEEGNTNYKMNPPLRGKADVEALKKALSEDVIDVIATDHAPHTRDDKNDSFRKAPFGIVGLETAAALTYTELVSKKYLTPMQMAEKMSTNPARIIGLDRGTLEEGKAADIVLFDPCETYVIDREKFVGKGKNTPFHGRKVTGKVRMTLVDGKIVYDCEKEREQHS